MEQEGNVLNSSSSEVGREELPPLVSIYCYYLKLECLRLTWIMMGLKRMKGRALPLINDELDFIRLQEVHHFRILIFLDQPIFE